MGQVLLISDDVRRSERLIRELRCFETCDIHDLYEAAAPACVAEVIVSDVATLTSDAILRLRRTLNSTRRNGVPFLFLVHGNPARTEAHARMLCANATLGATAVPTRLRDMLDRLQAPARNASTTAVILAGEAKQFLKETFFTDKSLTPELAETGTQLIARAVQEVGIREWVFAVQQFDDATHQHCLLVAGLAAAFSCSLGLNAEDKHRLAKGALLHDIGKTKIPIDILNKPGKLDSAELAIMRTHAALGHAMLLNQGFDAEILTVVRSHHEMLDGSGYPDKLKRTDIPDMVRLVTVCDIHAALIERRPYRPAVSSKAAYAILESMSAQLDGDLVQAFYPVTVAFS